MVYSQDYCSEIREETDKDLVRELHEVYGDDIVSICEKLPHLSETEIRNYIADLDDQK